MFKWAFRRPEDQPQRIPEHNVPAPAWPLFPSGLLERGPEAPEDQAPTNPPPMQPIDLGEPRQMVPEDQAAARPGPAPAEGQSFPGLSVRSLDQRQMPVRLSEHFSGPKGGRTNASKASGRWGGRSGFRERIGQFLVSLVLLVGCGGLIAVAFGQTADFARSDRRTSSAASDRAVVSSQEGSSVRHSPANRPISVASDDWSKALFGGPRQWTSPEGLSAALQILLLLTVLSLVPAILLMTTCFVRIVVVLGLLRQAIGVQNLPPSQVITGLALFVTLLIMAPVWKETYDRAIAPYSQRQIGLEEAWNEGIAPIRRFMSLQIERTGNQGDVYLFLKYSGQELEPASYEEVPLHVLVPAFMLSELKTAFLIGFQLYLPFLVIDMVVSSVLVSMGMLMLPPVMISMPLKLLLFVLVDGWRLVVGMLLESFQPYG